MVSLSHKKKQRTQSHYGLHVSHTQFHDTATVASWFVQDGSSFHSIVSYLAILCETVYSWILTTESLQTFSVHDNHLTTTVLSTVFLSK